MAALLSLQLGVGIEEDICEIVNLMRQICSDVSASEVVRSSCAQAIGLCVYLSVEVILFFENTIRMIDFI